MGGAHPRSLPLLILFVALASHSPAFAQFGSFAEVNPYTVNSAGWTPGGGFVESHSNDRIGYSRTTAVHGGNVSDSYVIRLPDGRHVALSHQLGIDRGGAFYGSGHAVGGSSVHAGGMMFGGGGARAMQAGAFPSPQFPAWSRTTSRSYVPGGR